MTCAGDTAGVKGTVTGRRLIVQLVVFLQPGTINCTINCLLQSSLDSVCLSRASQLLLGEACVKKPAPLLSCQRG